MWKSRWMQVSLLVQALIWDCLLHPFFYSNLSSILLVGAPLMQNVNAYCFCSQKTEEKRTKYFSRQLLVNVLFIIGNKICLVSSPVIFLEARLGESPSHVHLGIFCLSSPLNEWSGGLFISWSKMQLWH